MPKIVLILAHPQADIVAGYAVIFSNICRNVPPYLPPHSPQSCGPRDGISAKLSSLKCFYNLAVGSWAWIMSAVHHSGKLKYHTIMKIIMVITDIIILFEGRRSNSCMDTLLKVGKGKQGWCSDALLTSLHASSDSIITISSKYLTRGITKWGGLLNLFLHRSWLKSGNENSTNQVKTLTTFPGGFRHCKY